MQKIIPTDATLIPEAASRVFHGHIFDVYQWPQALFDGSSHTFEMLKRPDTVVAICVVEDEILVVNDEQPHFGVRKSFPGGRVDAVDDTIEIAAKREVYEETGYGFKQWRLVEVRQPHLKIEWFVYLFLAWDVSTHGKQNLDPGEIITVEHYSLPELKTQILNKKAGYLSEVQALFRNITTLEQLLALQPYSGQSVER